MQILYNCDQQRKNVSLGPRHIHSDGHFLSRSNFIHDNDLRFKHLQKMRHQLSFLTQQIFHLSPQRQSTNRAVYQSPEYQNAISSAQLLQSNPQNNIHRFTSFLNQHQYTLNIPTQVIVDDQYHQEADLNDTCQIMDNKFDRILEMNVSHNEDLKFDIQSKFIIVKSQKRINDVQFFQPDKIVVNTHQILLEQENYYLRDQLMQFTKQSQSYKHKITDLKHKYKTLKKDNLRIIKQMNDLRMTNNEISKQLYQKNQQCTVLFLSNSQNTKLIDFFKSKNTHLQNRLSFIEKQCQNYLSKLEMFQSDKQRQIQSIQQEKGKLKQFFEQQLCDKQRQISQLNEYISQLKDKISFLQRQPILVNADTSRQYRIQEQSNLFQEGTNSICLSLAEAQNLKNIIEEKQQQHKSEISSLKQTHSQQLYIIQLKLSQAQTKLAQALKINSFLQLQESKNQQKIQYLQSSAFQPAENLEDCKEGQDFIKANQTRRIKKLQKLLSDSHEEILQLLAKISYLQQHVYSNERQEDEQLQQLLQNCVNQLQKERQLNFQLRNQNDYYKKLICTQQTFGKTIL